MSFGPDEGEARGQVSQQNGRLAELSSLSTGLSLLHLLAGRLLEHTGRLQNLAGWLQSEVALALLLLHRFRMIVSKSDKVNVNLFKLIFLKL